MNVNLNIKNLSRLKEPKKGDIILFDGKEWYITTKDDVLQDAKILLDKCNEKIELLEKQNNEFKTKTSKDILEITETIKKIYELKGDKL